jgi:hypothetical protein
MLGLYRHQAVLVRIDEFLLTYSPYFRHNDWDTTNSFASANELSHLPLRLTSKCFDDQVALRSEHAALGCISADPL